METFKAGFRTKFIAGLLVTVPLLITVSFLWWVFKFIDGFLAPVYALVFGFRIPGLGFISAILLVFLAGIVATNVVGQRLLSWGEGLLQRIPIVKSIYFSVKQLIDAFSPGNKGAFKKFVIVEYPRPGIYSFGFLTEESLLEKSGGEQEELVAVYIPTNHLYLGEIVLFKKKDVSFPEITVEEGVRIILSGGITTPSRINVKASP